MIVVLVLVIILIILITYGKISWQNYTSKLTAKLVSESDNSINYVNLDEAGSLPTPVKKYFHLVLKNGQPIIQRARISQAGGFRAKPDMAGWSDMKAIQYFTTNPKGFVWVSDITIMPLLSINVCDSYIKGKGRMKGKLISTFTIINSSAQEELNQGTLQRYLAESVWFPTSLLPSQGVVWEEINEYKARATICDNNIEASLEFEFNDKGEIVTVYTPGRYREVKGRFELTPWKGTFSKYINLGGFLIPSEASVEWHLKSQIYSYFKTEIVDVSYE